MFYYIIMMAIICTVVSAKAECSAVTVRGPLLIGSLDSGVDGLATGCIFATNSDVARTIFKTCGFLDECEITGVVDQDENLVSVIRVRKIDVDIEPSNTVIYYAAYWSASICGKLHADVNTDVLVEIKDSSSMKMHEDVFWIYKFDIAIKEKISNKVNKFGEYSVRIVRRGSKWFYFMDN